MLRRNISTVIPSDLLRVGDALYLHAIVNQGFGNVVWTEIWRSHDGGLSWHNLGRPARFPGRPVQRDTPQRWTWDYNPRTGGVRGLDGLSAQQGLILRRVRPDHIGDQSRYLAWADGAWVRRHRDHAPGETWGELTLRRLDRRHLDCWAGFCRPATRSGYRTVASPTADLSRVPVQRPVLGCGWDREDHDACQVAQSVRWLRAAR